MTYLLIAGSIVVGTALLTDAKGTVHHLTIIFTIRGMTFVCKKMVQSLNKDAADIIDFTGWSLAGISIIKLIKLSTGWLRQLELSAEKIENNFERFSDWIDKITFWN